MKPLIAVGYQRKKSICYVPVCFKHKQPSILSFILGSVCQK